MKSYEYNCFIEDIMYATFDDILDMTCVYDRHTYRNIYTLLEYYYNNVVIAKLTDNRSLENVFYDSVNNIHDIVIYSNRINIIEFMLLCECINQINEYFRIDERIDFDDYTDIENAIITYYEYSDMSKHRQEFAFYDFSYCKINIIEYVRQYEKHDIYYYSSYNYDTIAQR